jgi:Cu/Ag efflux pump CusA
MNFARISWIGPSSPRCSASPSLCSVRSLSFGLPIAQYPEVVPPTVVVSATYPGADARTLAETVSTPLEQEINGVEDMLYLSSSSTSDGGCRSPSPSASAPI